MSTGSKSVFISRFDHIWAQARRVQISQALCWAALTLLAGIALLAAIDYWLELPLALRVGAIAAIGAGSVAVAITLAIKSVRRWRRQATAAAIEQVFPQLGQRIRTTVQFGELEAGQIEEAGVATTLVTALEADTVRAAQPLPLDAVIPWKSLALASMLAAAVGLGLAGLSAFDWQWRAAAQRAFLGDQPYTTITVEPGNLTLKEGESAVIRVTVAGRTGNQISFWSRQTDEPESQWEEEKLTLDDAQPAGERQVALEVPLERVRHPLEYRFAAGSATTKNYQVEVLYPLKIVRIQAGIRPPEYTSQPLQESEGGNISGLAGSKVNLAIELDRPAQTAWLVLRDLVIRRQSLEGEAKVTKLPLTIEGAKLVANLELNADQTYEVFAQSADEMELPENKYRIRVRQDEAPQVWFESPAEALEVHTLAEVLMRLRVSDDYGLTRAGIMFEVNNEEEYPLLAKDYLAAAEELKTTGKLTPQTRDSLEKMLPLEVFTLTQQDSVMYYAFAEDNRPGSNQRTESDLRFIDIRPFRRLYRAPDEGDAAAMMGQQGPQLKTLEELIARQRYALNRTIQLDRRFQKSGQADLAGVDALIKFEGELAKSTRELAEGLEARGIDETELLYQAETAMLGATDSLSAGKYDTATLQQRDALKYLIEGRNRLEIFIRKNPNRAQLAALRQFDRLQQQKLRRPKSDEEEAREVAERLEELADKQDFIYASLAGIKMEGMKTPGSQTGEGGGKPDPTKPPMPKAEGTEGAPMPMPKEGTTPEGTKPEGTKPEGTKPQGDKPTEGEKPEGTDPAGNKPEGNKPEGDKPEGAAGEKQPGENGAGKEPMDPAKPGAGPSRQELEDGQLDIAAEAREIEKVLGTLNRITDLAKERMAAAAGVAEDGAKALGSGKMEDAEGAAGAAREQFRELAEQVRGLLAEEQADRVAAAQRMAAELARQQQDFVDKLAQSENKGGSGDMPPMEKTKTPGANPEAKPGDKNDPKNGLGGAAEKIADKAQTLADVLGGAAKATSPEEQDAAKKVEELINGMGIGDLTERLKNLPGQVGQGKLEDAKATAGDGSDRLEAAAEALAALHRAIVAPRVEELAKVEEKLTGLDEGLDQLDTPSKITDWHMEAEEVMEEAEKGGMPPEAREEFLAEMKKAGWGTNRGKWDWTRTEGGNYSAPARYRPLLSRALSTVRGRMQELLLGELSASGDEPIPPQYQEFVDRYQQVLTTEGKSSAKQPAKATSPAPAP
jgi:hypothetical protein